MHPTHHLSLYPSRADKHKHTDGFLFSKYHKYPGLYCINNKGQML